MITGFFIQIFYTLIYSVFSLFPDGGLGLPVQFTDGITLIVNYAEAWNWLLPIDDMIAVVITILGIELIFLSVKLYLWVIRTIRGSGS